MRASPRRTCIGCRRAAGSAELVRVAWSGGNLVVSRTAPGRGAWLCAGSVACFEQAVRRNAFARALRAPLDPLAVTALRSALEESARIGSCGAGRGRN